MGGIAGSHRSVQPPWGLSGRILAGAGSIALHVGLIGLLLAPLQLPDPAKPDGPAAALPLVASGMLAPAPTAPAAPSPLIDTPAFERDAIALPTLPPWVVEDVAPAPFDLAREADLAGDAAELERLQEVYQGQLRGRLGRALEMVHGSHEDRAGPCTVHLIQNERGDVLDVDLAACAYDETTKVTLAQVLRRASPLPPPPSGLAMGSTLTVDLSRL